MTKQQIGQAVRKARGKKTRYFVCKEANITYQQLHAIEEGTKNYTIECLLQVCDILGLLIKVN